LPFDEVRGDLFVKDNPEFTRPVKLNVTKAQIGGVELLVKNPNAK
jgi:hypothetical protein